MNIPDLTGLSLEGFFGLLVIVMFFDVATASILALTQGKFSTAYVMNFLRTHVLWRVYLIFSLEVIGHGIPAIGVPAIGAAADAAVIALGLYVVETLGSLKSNATSADAP